MKMIEIAPEDILLGRGPVCYRNPGNVIFRKLIKEHCMRYTLTTPRLMKKHIVKSLIDKMHELGSRFLIRSPDEGSWNIAHSSIAQAKVGHALRDARMMAIDKVASKNKESPNSGRRIPPVVVPNMNKVSIPNGVKQAAVQGIEKIAKINKLSLENKDLKRRSPKSLLKNETHYVVSALNSDKSKCPTQMFKTTFDSCIKTQRCSCQGLNFDLMCPKIGNRRIVTDKRSMRLKHIHQQFSDLQPEGHSRLSLKLPCISHSSQNVKSSISDPMNKANNFHLAHMARTSNATPTEIWCPGPQRMEFPKFQKTTSKVVVENPS